MRTALGTARDVGTQFEVRLLAGAEARERLQVRVREGLVTVTPSAALRNGPDFRPALEVAAGAELVLHPDGHVEERPISSYDEEWQWILEVARFTAEDDTLAAILTWAGRETGWTIRYETDAVAATAARVRYRGAFAEVSPDEVPEVVRGAGLAARLEDGVLIVHDPAPVASGDDDEP